MSVLDGACFRWSFGLFVLGKVKGKGDALSTYLGTDAVDGRRWKHTQIEWVRKFEININDINDIGIYVCPYGLRGGGVVG